MRFSVSVKLLILCKLLVLVSLADATILSTKDGPEVGTLNGVLRGTWETSRVTKNHQGRQFSSFKGIPYAEPPQRFKSPQPPQNWTGVRNATLDGNVCPQMKVLNATQNSSVAMGEDCLFLNVYTPRIIMTLPGILPTMVYFHGGAFIEGAGSRMGPTYLMEQDIILVTPNYRLGALGFLSTGDGDGYDDMEVPGNMGLKDMIMALKWVRGNIGRFGGDPRQVTIFGESAGAAAVHAMMISPAATNLFQGVIAQSGSTLCPWTFQNDPKSVAIKFGAELGCIAKNLSDIVSCMKGKSMEDILYAQERTASMFISSPFVLTVDKFARDPVLPDTPRNLMENPAHNSAGLPLIMGWNEKEGASLAAAIILDPATNQDFFQNWTDKLPQMLGYVDKDGSSGSVKDQNRITNAITNFYFNNTNTNNNTNTSVNGPPVLSMANFGGLSNLATDAFFVSGIRRAALIHAAYNEKVFTYELTYQGNFSLVNALGLPSSEGPCHADDLRYLFNITGWQNILPASADEIFSENMTQLWASFAREGEPISWDKNGKWLPIKSSENKTTSLMTPVSWFNLNKDPRLVPENQDLKSRMEFWETVFVASESSASVGCVPVIVICTSVLISVIVVMEIHY